MMRSDQEIACSIRAAIDDCTRGIEDMPSLRFRIAQRVREDEPVVRKISTALVIALALTLLAITALAVSVIYNQEWYWNSLNSLEKQSAPDKYGAVMAHITENPGQRQGEDGPVRVTVQDVSWAPEVNLFTASFRVSPEDPARDELHSLWDLDADGASVREEGSAPDAEDDEDRAEHWLWRHDAGLPEEAGSYGRIPGWGPVREMMDDSGKRLLLVDCQGLFQPDGEPVPGDSMDMFRTVDGDVVCMIECEADWPDGDRAEIPVELRCTVVEYREGMDDETLYHGGTPVRVTFVIHPGADGK